MSGSNLLQSSGGVELLPEICLQIAGEVISFEPRTAGSLLRLSKSFHFLLSTYERSLCKSIYEPNQTKFAHTNSSQVLVLSSRMPPGNIIVSNNTYPWISEMQSRWEAIDFLVGHEITEMMDVNNHWPTLDVTKDELLDRLLKYKREALLLIYKLSDCVAGMTTDTDIRARQTEFLESLSSKDLASLGVMVEVMGQGFVNMTKSAIEQSGILGNSSSEQSSSTRHLYIPTSTPFQDLQSDHWIRECMCVFEDLIQRYGPYYAYAYTNGDSCAKNRHDLWARSTLQTGLDNMNAYEMGYTMAYASLQSVVWKVFCCNVGCAMQDSWSVAKVLVEEQMAEYKLQSETVAE